MKEIYSRNDIIKNLRMKRFTMILMALIALTMTANAQWSLQTNPLGSGTSAMVGKVQFISATEGWIDASHTGSLLHTTDAGTTWNIVTPFPGDSVGNMSDPATTMSWTNSSHGWVLKTYIVGTGDITSSGNGAVLYNTTDGGSSWAKKEFPKTIATIKYSTADLQGTWQLHEIVAKNPSSFSTNQAAWMHGTITLDGTGSGNLTNLVSNGQSQSDVSGLTLSISTTGLLTVSDNDMHGFMSADKSTMIITSTENGGGYGLLVLQKQVSETTYTTADLQGSWQMHVLSVGDNTGAHAGWGHAAMTGDASGNLTGNYVDVGNSGSLNMTATISSSGIIGGMSSFGPDAHGFMSADKKTFYMTMTTSENSDYNLVAFQKQATGTTYSSTDLQGNWQMHSIVADNTNDTEAWASWTHAKITIDAGGNGTLSDFVVNNESRSEQDVSILISADGILSGFGSDDSNGFMSPDKSIAIVTTTDAGSGGYTFGIMQKDLTISGDIGLQVQFVDNSNGWASNYNMIYGKFELYKTSDGGSTWNTTSNTVGGIYYFVDANNGWMITTADKIGEGNLNNIYHTTNGGSNWVAQASNIATANALYFTDLLHGWVVGKNGLILKTTDGGVNWTAITNAGLSSVSNSKCVFFLDANTGWVGTDNDGENEQYVLATTDAGVSWTSQSTPADYSIFSIYFWDATSGWFTSDYGQIGHYTYTPPKTVNITAGGLSSALTATEKATLTDIIVTGTMDTRDFKTLRDDMPLLTEIDLSGATVAEYTGTEGTYSTEVTDYQANEIPRLGFYNKKSLTSVILPTTITALGRSSFNSCSNLTSINIPSLVTSIGYAEFNFCSNLTSVNIPSGVKLIDTYTFGSCTSLKSITIPSSITSIGDLAFYNSGLTTITLPTGVDSIGQYVFQNCSALNSVTLPSTMTSIGDGAFNNSGLATITLPTGLKSIGQWAFSGCSSLNSVTISSTVSTIGYCAFTFDNALESIDVSAQNPYYSSVDGVLYNKSQQNLLCFPGGKGTDFEIPSTVSVIDTAAFEGSNMIRNVVIPSSVTTLSPEAFYWCQGLESTEIPASVTSIGGYSFYNCTALTTITVHQSTPVDLMNSDSVFKYINTTTCKLFVPVGSKAAYQEANQWGDFQNIIETGGSVTYNVTVPVGTKACYIAGEMNNWIQQIMTKVDDTNYTITIQNADISQKYKYCSGPSWDYQEMDVNGNYISDRSYSENDVVASWLAVFDPSTVTASDYYLPLKVGNYTELYTTYPPVNEGWSHRTTKYSFIRIDEINGIPYYLEEGWEDNFSAECNSCQDGPFRYMWIRKDAAGNLLAGAFATEEDYDGTLTDDISKAYVLPEPIMWFPNTFLNVGGYTTFATDDTVMSIDSVISVTATAGNYTNCIQLRNIERSLSGVVTFIEDSYYAYHVGLVMQNRLLPVEDIHTNYITDYLADSPTGIKGINSSENSFTLYPNPATDGFYINTGEKVATVSICNLDGTTILTKQLTTGKEFINVSNLSQGVYMVKISTNNGLAVTKLIKK